MKRWRALLMTLLVLVSAAVFFYFEGATLKELYVEYFVLSDEVQPEQMVQHQEKYYYSHLNETQQEAYTLIYQQLFDFPEKIKVPVLQEDEFQSVHEALVYDNPDLFFLSASCSMVFKAAYCLYRPTYVCTAEEYQKMRSQVESTRDEIYALFADGSNEYSREKVIHDQLISRCAYKESKWDSGIYGALVEGNAVCSGYARAAQYLLSGAGISNYLVTGTSESGGKTENHMWNTVFIGGKPYYLDVTWDDGDYEGGLAGYAYFNVTEEQLKPTHRPENPTENGCVYTDANYFVRENLYFTGVDEAFYAALTERLSERLQAGGKVFEIAFSSQDVYQTALDSLIEDQRIYGILRAASRQAGITMDTNYINYFLNDTRWILHLDLAENLQTGS